jgi:hypothetical protein
MSANRKFGLGKVSSSKKKAGGKPQKPKINWSKVKTPAQVSAAEQKGKEYVAKLAAYEKEQAAKKKAKENAAKLKTQWANIK